jgi:DNA-binding response OmpR family regulator
VFLLSNRQGQPGAESFEKYHALVVEDDPDSRDALCQLLQRVGYLTDSADSVKDAVAKLRRTPECLILDLALPDGSGVAVLRHVREMGLAVDVAVVSGAADGELLADAVLMHPDAMFTKPVDLSEIVAWLGATRARREVAAAESLREETSAGGEDVPDRS